jgi:LuxR family maltose regulon positive regulatory protein
LIEVWTLKALAFQKQNGGKITPQAHENLELALKLAEPEGYTLLFLEIGPEIIPMLNAVMRNPTTADKLKKYAGELLAAFFGRDIPIEVPAVSFPAPFEEYAELSQREIEILRLIGEGCSNQEIAECLFITLNTVKKHNSHIFAKLGVTSRTQAVARARQAGLL